MVAAAEAYPWSGHRADPGRGHLSWRTTDGVLGHFGEGVGTARRRYQRLVAQGVDEGNGRDFHAGPEDPRVLGDAPVTQAVLSSEAALHATAVTVDQTIAAVCQEEPGREGAAGQRSGT
jgi:hypothetical protein